MWIFRFVESRSSRSDGSRFKTDEQNEWVQFLFRYSQYSHLEFESQIAGTGKCEAVKIGMGTTVSTNPMVCSSELRGIKQKHPPFHTWGCSST